MNIVDLPIEILLQIALCGPHTWCAMLQIREFAQISLSDTFRATAISAFIPAENRSHISAKCWHLIKSVECKSEDYDRKKFEQTDLRHLLAITDEDHMIAADVPQTNFVCNKYISEDGKKLIQYLNFHLSTLTLCCTKDQNIYKIITFRDDSASKTEIYIDNGCVEIEIGDVDCQWYPNTIYYNSGKVFIATSRARKPNPVLCDR